jgi:hypothetical protein
MFRCNIKYVSLLLFGYKTKSLIVTSSSALSIVLLLLVFEVLLIVLVELILSISIVMIITIINSRNFIIIIIIVRNSEIDLFHRFQHIQPYTVVVFFAIQQVIVKLPTFLCTQNTTNQNVYKYNL